MVSDKGGKKLTSSHVGQPADIDFGKVEKPPEPNGEERVQGRGEDRKKGGGRRKGKKGGGE